MLIPLIPKDPDADDFSCRDGEIDYASVSVAPSGSGDGSGSGGDGDGDTSHAYGVRFSLTPEGQYPTFRVRVPLLEGEKEKAELMLQGEASRVDAMTADRITQAVLLKTASEFSDIVTDLRRKGLHLMPFRVYATVRSADGCDGDPTAQAVMIPAETPPHPEITAKSVTNDTLTLMLRIPVRPCRMSAALPGNATGICDLRVFVSYPLFIPDSDEVSGSLGSVASVSGGNVLGVRLGFLSEGNMKASVAAPEKYYRLYGTPQTGYRLSSKTAPVPDYTVYAARYGVVPSFPAEALVAAGSDTDPSLWIADWEKYGEGWLPLSLPYSCRSADLSGGGDEESGGAPSIPENADAGLAEKLMAATGWKNFLLTRPMALATAERSRRAATPKGVARLRILGLGEEGCVAVLLGSDDGRRYEALRIFDPRDTFTLLSPPRLLHRLLIVSEAPPGSLALEIQCKS